MPGKKQKSQAERVAGASKNKGRKNQTAAKGTAQKKENKTQKGTTQIPTRLITSVTFIILFIIFFIAIIVPEGILVEYLNKLHNNIKKNGI